jgi:hypothetical protein
VTSVAKYIGMYDARYRQTARTNAALKAVLLSFQFFTAYMTFPIDSTDPVTVNT